MQAPKGSKVLDNRISAKQYVQQKSKEYQQKLVKIEKMNLQPIQKLKIFTKEDSSSIPNLFIYNAQQYREDLEAEVEGYILQTIEKELPMVEHSFSVAYLHHSWSDFLAFRHMVEKWPQHFYLKLRTIYIVKPSFFVKIIQFFSFGTFYRIMDQIALSVSTKNDMYEIEKEYLDKKLADKPKSVSVNVPGIIKNQLFGKKLEQYKLDKNGYPQVLTLLLERIVTHPQDLTQEGIFRKSCNVETLEEVEKAIISKDYDSVKKERDIFVIAGCIKKLFHNLEEPLFCFQLYGQVNSYVPSEGNPEEEFISSLLKKMKPLNNKVFVLMCHFFRECVISNEKDNRMSPKNIAIVLGPCLFRPKSHKIEDLLNSPKFCKVILYVLTHFTKIVPSNDRLHAQETLTKLGWKI